MQRIFSIDFSNIPIVCSLNAVSNKDITVINDDYIDIDGPTFLSELLKDKFDEGLESKIIEGLKVFLKRTHANNENTIIIVPPIEQIALNLELPFATPPKHLDKIIKNEVQDLIPLSGDELHVQYQILKKVRPSGSLPVHVSLLSENIFRNILRILKKVGIDPFVITTPAGVLGVISHFAKDFFKTDSAVIEKWGNFIHLLYIHEGTQIHERSLPLILNNEKVSIENLMSQIKIALRAFEKDADAKIDFVYYGKNVDERIVKNFGKESDLLDLGQFVNCENENNKNKVLFSALSSFLVQDSMPFSLSNFRMGKFDCVITAQEVLKILKALLPITISFLLCIFIGIYALYFIREARIEGIYNGIKQATIDKVALQGGDNEEPEKVISALASARNTLEADLSQIASSYSISPSKILEILSLDLSTIKDLEVNSFDFRANSVKLFGTISSYSDFEKLEKLLNKRKNIFKTVEATQSAGKNKMLNFTVTIGLED